MTAQTIVNRLKQSDVSEDEVLENLQHEAALVRVNAIEAAARLAQENDHLLAVIAREAQHARNSVLLLGTTTVGHVAVGCLLRVGTSQATDVAMSLIDAWAEEERKNLVWYLKSEGLLN